MSSKPFFAKRHFVLVGVASTTVLVAFSLLWGSPIHSRSATQFGVPNDFHDNSCSATTGLPADVALATQPIRHRNIAIASTFGFHHDVYLALAWTMERVMNKHGKLQVYANLPFAYAFQDIVDQLGLYHGEVKPTPELIPAMKELGGDGGGIDMLILGTCEVDLRGDWHEQLLAAWDARDKDHKFTLVCIVHHVLDKGWQPHIADWARRGALRLLPISSHVAAGFRHSFDESADSTDPSIRHAGYEYIPIDIHIPILDLPNLPDRNDDKTLSKAVIQGSFSLDRRDYIHLFEDLKRSLAGAKLHHW
ncbi:hypothetical protein ONZ45_g3952 [Pleurotus djamor]|nr:hypothetical protein ONZ45_g3952 [Pleurotus djamor]